MKIHYGVMGPVPVNALSEVLKNIYNQKWETKFVSFSGMVQLPSLITPKPEIIPSYIVVVCKEYEGDKPPELKIEVGGNGAKNTQR
jgi:hypothetical protein